LFPEQLIFIMNDAADRVVIFDKTFVPLIKAVKPLLTSVEHFICLDAADPSVTEAIPEVQLYDDLIASQHTEFEWPVIDENAASARFYTSGPTGNPNGVLYRHPPTVSDSYAIIVPDSLNVSAPDIILPVVPLFHVNARGTPFAAA